MKILWLYRYIPEYNFDHWLHMGYARSIRLQTEIVAYGPRLREVYADIVPIGYSPDLSLNTLYELLHFDIIIINTKSRCFFNYNPKKGVAEGMWLPPDFSVWSRTPKVVIEEDYHYEKSDSWYVEMGIDLIIQRHYSQALRQEHVPMLFMPFSVDTVAFNDLVKYPRKTKFAFTGSSEDSAYAYRRMAIESLSRFNLCDNHFSCLREASYIEVLQKYLGYVSCGSIYEIVAAKNFEIMASGGILFTNKFQGIDLVFPPDAYCGYENDPSDIVSKGVRLIEDVSYQQKLLRNAKECILGKHTHEIRTQEMLSEFKERFSL